MYLECKKYHSPKSEKKMMQKKKTKKKKKRKKEKRKKKGKKKGKKNSPKLFVNVSIEIFRLRNSSYVFNVIQDS